MNEYTSIGYGWNSHFEGHFTPYDGKDLFPGRIGTVFRDRFEVLYEGAASIGRCTGKMLSEIQAGITDMPVCGDWVVCRQPEGADFVLIEGILPRKSFFRRQEAGKKTAAQYIAANLDYLFICTGLDRDYKIRRIERYLIAAWESGVSPVVILTKSDLMEDPSAAAEDTSVNCPGTPVHAVSAKMNTGLEALRPYFASGSTVGLIGSSGCGKSTLLNRLAGEDLQKIGELRNSDGRGRHTTTSGRLHLLSSGACIIDTPGLREVGLWDEGGDAESDPYSDIRKLSESCRFSDCTHRHEPHCAVKSAIEEGILTPERYREFLEFTEEIGMTKKKREEQRREKGKRISKLAKEIQKNGKRGRP